MKEEHQRNQVGSLTAALIGAAFLPTLLGLIGGTLAILARPAA